MKGLKKMKYSIQFSDTIHILAYIEIFKNTNLLSSEIIAGSVKTNPANIRRIMSNLKKANLITTQTGKANPILTKPPEEISLLDVYKSIEGNTNLIHVDPKTNPDCIVGANIQQVLSSKYELLQQKIELEMDEIKLDSIIHDISVLESKDRPQNNEFITKFL
ncbi:TPA: Rrf2 family transcriptional regulator [Listeria monocytogenes]|nr:Rrf2 family transcriptional regulator [Listeria monocytogenes]HDU0485471.1 Rrf2 family transcriptional regulator [Listeria monocytogenes]